MWRIDGRRARCEATAKTIVKVAVFQAGWNHAVSAEAPAPNRWPVNLRRGYRPGQDLSLVIEI